VVLRFKEKNYIGVGTTVVVHEYLRNQRQIMVHEAACNCGYLQLEFLGVFQ